MSTQLHMGYSDREELHDVLPNQTQVWRIGKNN
jgi:hypothetical protein